MAASLITLGLSLMISGNGAFSRHMEMQRWRWAAYSMVTEIVGISALYIGLREAFPS